MRYRFPIVVTISLLHFGCSNRPMSMAGFMSNVNTLYADLQLSKGDLIDSLVEDENSFDYTSYQELPINLTVGTSYETSVKGLIVGGSVGINGLNVDAGFQNQYFGMMAWLNAQIGIPCYGTQAALRIINDSSRGFGIVSYYSKNEVVQTEGEQLSFGPIDIQRGFSYDEFGGGLYYVHRLSNDRSLLFDLKIGKNVDYNTFKAYFDVSYGIGY